MRTFALRRSCWVRGNHLTIDGGGCRESRIPVLVHGSDRSIPWPASSFAHPIPRVIIALGIKAIADSRIASIVQKVREPARPPSTRQVHSACQLVVFQRNPDHRCWRSRVCSKFVPIRFGSRGWRSGSASSSSSWRRRSR